MTRGRGRGKSDGLAGMSGQQKDDTARAGVTCEMIERIGKYRVLRLLGEGGMGRVYLAEDPHIDRRVAVKIMTSDVATSRERFQAEARIIGALSHPNIVVVHEFGFEGERPYLVMEYLPGENLLAWMKTEHRLGAHSQIMAGLCKAVSHAHRQGVVHRDIKPGNVQVLPDGESKLMDFGIARAFESRLTAEGIILGTPIYMAPEVLLNADYSPKSDIYALALVFYEMLTGRNPFQASTIQGCLYKAMHENPVAIGECCTGLPDDFSSALMACIEKSAEARPSDLAPLTATIELLRLAGDADFLQRHQEGSRSTTQTLTTTPPGQTGRATPIGGLSGALTADLEAAVPRASAAEREAAPAPLPVLVASAATASRGETKRGRGWRYAGVLAGAALAGAAAFFTWLRAGEIAPPNERSAGPPALVARAPEQRPTMLPTATTLGTPPEAPTPLAAATGPPSRRQPGPRAHATRPAATPRLSATSMPKQSGAPEPTPSPNSPPARPTASASAVPADVLAAPHDEPPPRETSAPAPVLEELIPRFVRRGEATTVVVRGRNFHRSLQPIILRGPGHAKDVRILSFHCPLPHRCEITLIVDHDAPLGTRTLALSDATGHTSNKKLLEIDL